LIVSNCGFAGCALRVKDANGRLGRLFFGTGLTVQRHVALLGDCSARGCSLLFALLREGAGNIQPRASLLWRRGDFSWHSVMDWFVYSLFRNYGMVAVSGPAGRAVAGASISGHMDGYDAFAQRVDFILDSLLSSVLIAPVLF